MIISMVVPRVGWLVAISTLLLSAGLFRPASSSAVDSTLECKIHVLAVEFAKEIQPERELSAVLSGLQVTSSDPSSLSGLNCTFGPVPPPAPPAPPPPPPSPPPAWPALGHCSPPHPGWSLAQESGAKLAGKTETVAACEALCKGSNCSGYTWHDKTCAGYYQDCYVTSGTWAGGVSITAGHLSGICNNGQPPPPNVPPPIPAAGACSAIVDGWSMTTAPGGQSGSAGKTPTAMGCETKCKATAKCTAFTWHDKTTGSFATDCYLITSGATWSQGSSESGHHTALCTPHSRATAHVAAVQQQEEPALQSYGGIMRPSSLWPVPGQGNDDYPRGSWRPADGKSRSHGLLSKRQGVPEIPAAASILYVDYGAGSDTGAGSKTAPLKTIAAAVARASSLPAPRTIFLTGSSTHYLSETVRITPKHSQLTITSLSGQEEAVISGGVEFRPKWTMGANTSDGKATIYTTAVPKGLRFLELFNASTSARYVPAREPNGNVELDQNNYHSRATSWLPAVDFGVATLVTNGSYIDASGNNHSINRGGMFDEYAVGVGGPANNFKPSTSYWAQAHPRGGGASTYTIPSGMVVGRSAITEGVPPPTLSSGGKDGFVFMMHTHAW
eukprot:COSAG01_NODE_1338_length_10666_cov_79.971231_8_plen_614_part_00